jgi:hypothetical protein
MADAPPTDTAAPDERDDADRDPTWRSGRGLGLALVASLVLWQLPFGGFLLYPFKLLATWIHELSHGLVMLTLGAGFDHMEVFRDTSGLAHQAVAVGPVRGAMIAAAGYMGTPVFGATMMIAAPRAGIARRAVFGMGAALALSAALVVSNSFGQIAVAISAAVLIAVALALPARWVVGAAYVLASQACVNAVLDIRVLFRPTLLVNGEVAGASDASNMALATFGTDAPWAVRLWATVWLAWSLGITWLALRALRRAGA